MAIVGAEIVGDKKLVYFIDPLDGSDPSDIKTQKIYAMSYKTLQETITNDVGVQCKTEAGELVFEERQEKENRYAIHAGSDPLQEDVPECTACMVLYTVVNLILASFVN